MRLQLITDFVYFNGKVNGCIHAVSLFPLRMNRFNCFLLAFSLSFIKINKMSNKYYLSIVKILSKI